MRINGQEYSYQTIEIRDVNGNSFQPSGCDLHECVEIRYSERSDDGAIYFTQPGILQQLISFLGSGGMATPFHIELSFRENSWQPPTVHHLEGVRITQRGGGYGSNGAKLDIMRVRPE